MNEDYKKLAEAYFSGKISHQDEVKLFDFIQESTAHEELFRAWHAEWAAKPHFDLRTERAWQRLMAFLFAADTAESQGTFRWRSVAAAAVVLVMMAGTAVGTWWFAVDHTPEQYYTLSAPLGSRTQLALPDGTKVWLNAGSSLRYSNRFGKQQRVVQLDGEGYFEVAKQKDAEFVVNTRGYDVIVKGTRFNVSAYMDDTFITTTLIQGTVLVDRDGSQLLMQPGDKVSLNVNSGELMKGKFTNDARAWTHGWADYEEITLYDLAKILSRQYNVQVRITSEPLRHMKFSISLRNKETIDDVLHALQRIAGVHVHRSGKDIYISDK